MRLKQYLNEGKSDITLKVNKAKDTWIIFKGSKAISKKYKDKAMAVSKLKRMKKEQEQSQTERRERRLKPNEYEAIAKEVMNLLKHQKTITKRDIKYKDTDKIDKALSKMEKQGIIQADVRSSYDTVSIKSGHFGGKTALARKRKHYRKK